MRSDRREPIFTDGENARAMLAVVEQAMDRFGAQVLAFCLMGNYYHFVLHTRQAYLAQQIAKGPGTLCPRTGSGVADAKACVAPAAHNQRRSPSHALGLPHAGRLPIAPRWCAAAQTQETG